MSFSKLKNLRRRVWPKDQEEIGEALRDIHGFCSSLTLTAIVPVTGAVWSEPFSLSLEQRPTLLLLGEARLSGSSTAIELCALDWELEPGATPRARIKRARTLSPGTTYDLKFLAVY